MATHLALLRGINVGGKHRVPMEALRGSVEALGHTGVRTYIQSGNVVFDAAVAGVTDVALQAELAGALGAAFGFPIPVVVRTRAAMEAIAAALPFPEAPEAEQHVGFLGGPAAIVGELDPTRSPGDRAVVRGQELYLHLPKGVATTKYTTDWLERRLGTVVTARNWNTVRALADLVRA